MNRPYKIACLSLANRSRLVLGLQKGFIWVEPFWGTPLNCTTCFARKHKTKLERPARDKHSSLLSPFISYKENDVLCIQPQLTILPTLFEPHCLSGFVYVFIFCLAWNEISPVVNWSPSRWLLTCLCLSKRNKYKLVLGPNLWGQCYKTMLQ